MRLRSHKECRRSLCSLSAVSLVLVASLVGAAGAIEINSPPNVVGSGARALGMGGAFIAVADDATAASWNPGGLPQLERPEISAVYSWKFYHEDFNRGQQIERDVTEDIDFSSLNYLSIVYPFRRTIAGRNIVISLNYHRMLDFDRELDVAYHDIEFLAVTQGRAEFRQSGSLGALSPALGFELTDRLSLGVAVNLWDQSLLPDNEWKQVTRSNFWTQTGGLLTAGRLIEEERYEDFDGINYTFGLLFKPTDRWSIGLVHHTKFAADVKYTLKRTLLVPPVSTVHKQDRRIEFPSAWGLGLAYRFPNDKLTLALDVTRREWDEFVEIERGPTFFNNWLSRRRFSPITGLEKWRSHHKATYTVRLGGEYVFFNPDRPLRKYLPSLRLGAFYDPEPAGGRRVGFLGLGPVTGDPDDYWGATFGVGVLVKNRVNVDFAYQYRWGDDIRKDTFSMWDVDGDVEQHELYLSTVIYF